MSNSIFSMLYNREAKKAFILLTFLFTLCYPSYAREDCLHKEKLIAQNKTLLTINEQADSLKKYGDLILHYKGKKKAKYERLFFKYFPNTFKRFNSIYGFIELSSDSAIFMPLYSSNHIEKILPNLYAINKETYYKKLINVSLGGHWQGDQVGVLQNVLIGKVKDDLNLTIEILKTLNDGQIKSFWLFFFDMENPSAVDFSFLNKIKDKNINRIIKQAREEDKIKWSKR